MRLLLVTSLLLSACGPFKRDNTPSEPAKSDRLAELTIKKAKYCELGKQKLTERGFMDDRCDSLLFTALWSTACGPIDLSSWEDTEKPGKWHRNPQRDCFLNGAANGSKSSISRDMFLGLWHHLLSSGDSQNAKEIVEYGEANTWIMGEAEDNETLISRCLLSPQLITLARDLSAKLSGSTLRIRGEGDGLPVNIGFRAHLDVQRILLSGRVYGAISDIELGTLKDQSERQPNNALFQAAHDKFSNSDKAIDLLLREDHFPKDRLPNNHDNHCINYLFSKDEGSSDWAPCKEEPLTEHDGTDFVFASWVVLEGK